VGKQWEREKKKKEKTTSGTNENCYYQSCKWVHLIEEKSGKDEGEK